MRNSNLDKGGGRERDWFFDLGRELFFIVD